jgi:tRNA pseudouridine38-40 synthase
MQDRQGLIAEGLEASQDAPATLVLELGYRGGSFSGFAEQEGSRTVAGELRRALETMLHRSVDLTCAGRTDAGVHAVAQYVSLPVTQDELALSGRRLMASLTALVPDDMSVRRVLRGNGDFSARFDAQARRYRYRISCGRPRPMLLWGHTWWLRPASSLDVDAMNEAAQLLVGEHDFTSFCKVSSARMLQEAGRSLSRNLLSVCVSDTYEVGEPVVVIDVEGNAFLHNMVRIMTGTLVEVGRGFHDASWVGEVLASRDRTAAGMTAPPEGLTFVGVDYPDGLLSPWE